MRLEAYLQEHATGPVEVLNAGDVMWSLGHALVRAKREIPRLKPRWVILYAGINEKSNYDRLKLLQQRDLAKELKVGNFGAIDNNLHKANWLARDSITFKIVSRWILPHLRFTDLKTEDLPYDPAILDNYQNLLKEFHRLVSDNGGQLIFVTQAMAVGRDEVERADELRGQSPLLRTSFQSSDLARQLGAIVLDAQDMVNAAPDPASLFITIAHYSDAGADALAKFLANRLAPYLSKD